MEKIFVQIASYRDPELLPTIRDCINKAKYPERLYFGICWQRDETESLEEFTNDPNFKIINIHWSRSKGLCWARSLIQKLWDGEEYTIQLDSHHRFLQDWDEHLITMMKLTGSEKPIISSYAGMYRPYDNAILNNAPYKMVASNFTEGGTILFRPHHIDDWENLEKPIPARFVSGHFFFTLGIHCKEYKYDPNIYFAGDEISLSIRSFTLGYDLYHPHYTVIWHEYTRHGRVKHWDDFDMSNVEKRIVDKLWFTMDTDSKRRLRHMLQEEDNGIDLEEYGLGSIRTHRDYELYAGIDFKNKKIHPDTLLGKYPPINDDTDWYKMDEKEYSFELDIPNIEEKYKFIYIGIESENGILLYRKDLTEYISKLKVDFKSFYQPIKSVIWPMLENGEWGNRIDNLICDCI